MRIYRAFRPLAKLLIPQWNYLRFELARRSGRRQRGNGDGSLSLPRVKAGGALEMIWGRGAREVLRGGWARAGYKVRAGLGLAAAPLAFAACASPQTYSFIPLAPGAADPALQTLARRAGAGDKQAQLELGIRYEEGRGVSRDFARAEKLYRAAARESGGVTIVYNPPATKGGAGSLQRLDHGPAKPGLTEARERLERLRRQRKTIRETPGLSIRLEESS